jgi:hypothetical protein
LVTIGLETAEEAADELGVWASKRAATSTLEAIILPSTIAGGVTKLAAKMGNISAGKNGEMMIGWVSEVLTTCPNNAGPGVDLMEDKSGVEEANWRFWQVSIFGGAAGMMTPEETASSTTMASSTFRLFSSSGPIGCIPRFDPAEAARSCRGEDSLEGRISDKSRSILWSSPMLSFMEAARLSSSLMDLAPRMAFLVEHVSRWEGMSRGALMSWSSIAAFIAAIVFCSASNWSDEVGLDREDVYE